MRVYSPGETMQAFVYGDSSVIKGLRRKLSNFFDQFKALAKNEAG